MQVVCDYGMWVIGMGAIVRREGNENEHGARKLRVLQGSKRLEPNCPPVQQEGCWLEKRKQFQVSDVMGLTVTF